jgi:hypothetical protein
MITVPAGSSSDFENEQSAEGNCIKEKDSRTGGKKSFYFILAYFFPLVVNFFTKIFRNFGIRVELGEIIC